MVPWVETAYFSTATAVIQDDQEIFCQCHDPAIFVPAKILPLLMLSAFHHFILTDRRCFLGHHHSFTFLF
ncbi:TPA: hypothetical protein HNC31_06725 [Escherichia coli]|nr:hypothetical protein [Escherichia coli]